MSARSVYGRLPDAGSTAAGLGAVRTLVAAVILAAPVPAARLLGADGATARRVTWLTRMMGVRDGAIGVGGLAAQRRGGAGPWVLAGAVSDAVDAIVIVQALRAGRMRGVMPIGIVAGASGAATVGALTAVRLRRRA